MTFLYDAFCKMFVADASRVLCDGVTRVVQVLLSPKADCTSYHLVLLWHALMPVVRSPENSAANKECEGLEQSSQSDHLLRSRDFSRSVSTPF